MNVLQIKIYEDGTLECSPDFKIIRGSYRNIIMNVEVPHSLLLDPVNDQTTNQAVTGNFVRVAAIIRTVVGKNLQTQKYDFEVVKDYERDCKMYRLYQRIMPKEFTLWATVNQSEAVGNGYLQLIFNVVNWTKSDAETPPLQNVNIEQIVASPILRLDVYAGAFIEDIEAIENPKDYAILSERVDNVEIALDKADNDINALQEKDRETDVKIKSLQDKDEEIITNTEMQIQSVQDKTEEDINKLRMEVNEKPYFFGWFSNYDDLIANFPTATENDYAYIIGGNIYEYHDNQWVDTGNKTPDNIAPLSDDDPMSVGNVASPGTSSKASKSDHVHADSEQTKQNTINIENKVDKNQIVQETGQSETNIMSQKAVTTQLDELEIKTERLPLKDTRHSGEASTWYMKNAPRSMIGEFKDNSDIGLNSITNAPFACLFTITPWWDKSGGTSSQLAFTNEPNKFYYRTADGFGNNWYPWQTFASMPIGSVLMFADDTHPASIYGGTWEKLTNRVLVGAGDKYNLGVTGGSEDAVVIKHGGHIRPAGTNPDTLNWEVPPSSNNSYFMSIDKVNSYGSSRTFMVEYGNEVGFRTFFNGEDGKGKNMMPFLAVNIWKKIA